MAASQPQARTSARYVTIVAAGAAVGGLVYGYDTSTMNAAVTGIRSALRLGSGTVGSVVAIVLIGAAAGAWGAGPGAARFGRVRIMALAGTLILVGSLGAALAGAVVPLELFRFVTGLGIGGASAVVPPYIAEISPTRIRGRLGTFWQLATVSGQFAGLVIPYGLTRWAGSETAPLPWGGSAWRWMFVAVALLAVAYVVITRWLPRSPYVLMHHGHEAEARAVVTRLSPGAVDERLADIRRTHRGQPPSRGFAALRGPRFGLQPIVWTGILLAAFQQLVGINVAKTYSNTLWHSVGLSTNASFTVSIITALVSIAAALVAIGLMDTVGRKPLLLCGAAVMTLALGTMAGCFASASGSGTNLRLGQAAGITALVAMNVFSIAFGITWGPIMWLMLGELFASDIRTTAVAVCTAVNWLTNWAVTRSFPSLATVGLAFAYGLYTAFAVLAVLFVWKAVPETRGRPLS